MGGAATALGGDASAVYYNPAGLTFCDQSQASVEVRHTAYDLHVDPIGSGNSLGAAKPVPHQTRLNLSTCIRLPYHLAFGFLFGAGLQKAAEFDHQTPNPTPQFSAYGEPLEQLTIALGVAYRPIPELAIGIGGAVLIHSDIQFATDIPILQVDPNTNMLVPISVGLRWRMRPTGAPYLGLLASPVPWLRIGVTYRGPLEHHVEGPLDIQAEYASLKLPLPVRVATDTWYSPRQVAGGVTLTVSRRLTVVADLTWYQFTALRSNDYPFIKVSAGDNNVLLAYPELDPLGWRNVWAPRVGVEVRPGRHVALRAGYGFRTAMLTKPGTRNSNVLDGPVHSLSIGAGWMVDIKPAEHRRHARRAPRPGYEATGWRRDEPAPKMRFHVDGFGRMSIMAERRDHTKNISYGGKLFDAGVTLTLGWY